MEDIEILGLSASQLQEIYENSIKRSKSKNPSLMFLDASYGYTFELKDSEYVTKINKLGRYNPKIPIEWHHKLERWYNDQTVINAFGREFKPYHIDRTLDRVTNQGMQMIAVGIVGEGGDTSTTTFNFRSIGDGPITEASPADVTLSNVIDVIDVNNAPEGGSLTRNGTTIFSIGNHAKTVATPANGVFTECGMHNTDDTDIWLMFDHSVFASPIPHTQNADSPGSTTVIYMCSA